MATASDDACETMTVKGLIRLLESYPPNLRVVVDGYEDGWDDLSPEQVYVRKMELHLNDDWWDGPHGDPDFKPDHVSDDSKMVEALVLSRMTDWRQCSAALPKS